MAAGVRTKCATWGKRPFQAWLALAALCLCSLAHAATPANLVVYADGSTAERQALEHALVQQFAGEPVRLFLDPEKAPEFGSRTIVARLVFEPEFAELAIETPHQPPSARQVRGSETHELCRTLAIILADATMNLPAGAVAPLPIDATIASGDASGEPSDDPGADAPRDSAEVDPERERPVTDPSPHQSDARTAFREAELELSTGPGHSSESEMSFTNPLVEQREQHQRPLHPWVPITGFIVTGGLATASIVSAAQPIPWPDVDLSDEDFVDAEVSDAQRRRARSQRTTAFAASAAITGTISLVLATTFTRWKRKKSKVAWSVSPAPGGATGQFSTKF